MRHLGFTRFLCIFVVMAVFGLVASGCGSDDPSQTNAGAPAGASGDAAGGAAVEAGKQRPEDQVEQEKKTYGSEPPPVQLQTGERSGYSTQKPTVQVVHSRSELRDLQKKLKASGVEVATTPVEFDTRQVVLVQLPKSKAGDLMQISQVSETDGKIVVKAIRIKRGAGCKSHGATNPFSMVETRKMKGTPMLKFSTISNSPCN